MFSPGESVTVRGQAAKIIRNVGGGDYLVKMDDDATGKPVAVHQRQIAKAGAKGGPDGRSGVQAKSADTKTAAPKGKSPAKAAKDAAKASPKAPKGKGKAKTPSEAPSAPPAPGEGETVS